MGVLQKLGKSAASRLDDFINTLTGLGSAVRDKLVAHQVTRRTPLTHEELAALYDDDPLAQRICSKPVNDALRRGWTLTCSAELSAEEKERAVKAITARAKALGFKAKVRDAAIMGRALGLGAVYVGAEDGLTKDKPLDPDRVTEVRFLTVLDARDLAVLGIDQDSRSPTFLGPKFYQLTTAGGGSSERVHPSRLMIFGGVPTSFRTRQLNQNRDLSILHRCHNAIRDCDSSFHSAALALVDGSLGILKIKGLYEELGGPMSDALKNRIEVMDLARFVARCIPIDSEEEYSFVERALTAWPDLLDRMQVLVSASADIPVTLLFGRSPAGENATGESDLTNYYDGVQSWRDDDLQPAIELGLQLIAREVGAPEPEAWGIKWPSLWQETEKEKLERRKLVADADHIYITDQVYLPEEVAIARANQEDPLAPPEIDVELRRRFLKSELKREEEDLKKPKPVPPPPSGPPAPGETPPQFKAKAGAKAEPDPEPEPEPEPAEGEA